MRRDSSSIERDDRLFLVTARHVVKDEATKHRPDSLLIAS